MARAKFGSLRHKEVSIRYGTDGITNSSSLYQKEIPDNFSRNPATANDIALSFSSMHLSIQKTVLLSGYFTVNILLLFSTHTSVNSKSLLQSTTDPE